MDSGSTSGRTALSTRETLKMARLKAKVVLTYSQANSPAPTETFTTATGLKVSRMGKARSFTSQEPSTKESSNKAKDTDEANISGLTPRSTTRASSSMARCMAKAQKSGMMGLFTKENGTITSVMGMEL